MMASVICTSADRTDIPIFPGTESPLLTPQKQPIAYQAEIAEKIKGDVLKPVLDFANACSVHGRFVTFHDPLVP